MERTRKHTSTMIDTTAVTPNKVRLKTVGQGLHRPTHPVSLYDEYFIDEMKDIDFDEDDIESPTPCLGEIKVIQADAFRAKRRISGISNYDEYELDDPFQDDSTTTSLEDEHVQEQELPIKGITKRTKRLNLSGMHFAVTSNYNEYNLDDENDDQTDSMTGISLYEEYAFENENTNEPTAPKKGLSLTGVSIYNEYDCNIHQDEIETVGASTYDEYDYDEKDRPSKRPPTPFMPPVFDIPPHVVYPIEFRQHVISNVLNTYDEYDCDADTFSSLG
jgi:hypothetical protein